MFPIFSCYDSGVEESEVKAIVDALKEFRRLFPERRIFNYGSKPWCKGDFSSADWYVKNAKELPSKQKDASDMALLLAKEPWQKTSPHIDVLFTSKDLSFDDNNFVFGLAYPSLRVTVQSVARYRILSDEDKTLAIKAVVWHELGHILGCAHPGRVKTKYILGSHCTNPGCIMQQGLSVPVWLEHAKQAKALHQIYCPLCMEEAMNTKV